MTATKPILAFETVFDTVSLCLYADGGVLDFACETAKRKQTERILPMLDALLKNNALKIEEIGALAFNRGPGSFSGIRINTAVVQALAWAHELVCLPVSGLAASAQAVFEAHADLKRINIALDARMNEVYFATFDKCCAQKLEITSSDGAAYVAELVGEEVLLPYDAKLVKWQDAPFAGDGVEKLVHIPKSSEVLPAESHTMSARHIAQLGWRLYQAQGGLAAHQAQPVYLRNNAWKTLDEQKSQQ